MGSCTTALLYSAFYATFYTFLGSKRASLDKHESALMELEAWGHLMRLPHCMHAMQALSQLSYGPVVSNSSGALASRTALILSAC
jgi:hypothetical protein